VDQPAHPLHALTTFELRDYRRRLESAIAHFGAQDDPVPSARAGLQARLDDVIAEQEDRVRIADALARPDSPARVPILAYLSAVDTELAGRAAARRAGS
jgi:hypothetical protein